MHWEHVFGSSCFLWNIFPSLTYWEFIIFLAETISLAHLTSIPSPPPTPGKDFILVSLCFSPQCFSEEEEEDVRVSLVLFSKYAHLSFEKKNKKKNFSPFKCGEMLFL